MASTLSRHPSARAVLRTRGSGVRFGLRVKVVAYPDSVAVVWVMLAVRFASS